MAGNPVDPRPQRTMGPREVLPGTVVGGQQARGPRRMPEGQSAGPDREDLVTALVVASLLGGGGAAVGAAGRNIAGGTIGAAPGVGRALFGTPAQRVGWRAESAARYPREPRIAAMDAFGSQPWLAPVSWGGLSSVLGGIPGYAMWNHLNEAEPGKAVGDATSVFRKRGRHRRR